MKNALKKTIMIAAMLFCSNLAHAKSNNALKQNKIQAEQIFFKASVNKSFYNHQLSPMLALQSNENLRTYHLGAKFFNPAHKVPTEKDLSDSIKSHPFFIGRFTNEPNYDEYVSLKDQFNYSFFILETVKNDKIDFYMVHLKGIRHFVISTKNDRQDNLASIDNSAKNYPDLESFIKCTLGSQSV